MTSLLDVVAERETILTILWFFIGFGTGLALIRLWKIILIGLVAAFLAPVALAFMGLSLPITPENILDAVVKGLEMFAGLLASRPYGALGFVVGAGIGLALALARWRS
ncbi:MAG: hypothetical protein QW318_03370 [Candidatus Caldarchaeum sp.]|jgi:hypothetical protein|uniref:Uncharacterized protein n=1 Tax=Caldiarchaeum subterraneum TaxID=311458 RepID=A0A7C4E146_CALS0